MDISKMSDQFFKDLGLGDLPEKEKEEKLKKLDDVYSKMLTLELASHLSDKELEEINNLSDKDISTYLEEKGIDVDALSQKIAFALRDNLMTEMAYLKGKIDSSTDNN
jgi:hypothetical protein